VNRRLIAFIIAFAWLAGCGGGASGPVTSLPQSPLTATAPGSASRSASRDTSPNELPEPPVVHAVNGVAKVSLIANINPATGLPAFQYQYMHGVAPTIDINPGETFEFDLSDQLPPSKNEASYANLHFHGLTVTPHRPSDDVLTMLAKPGQSLHYVVHVPKNQEPGLYWYHMHVHGQTSYQVGEGGMSGAIVIEGLEKHIPELAKMKQRLIVYRATGVGQNLRVRSGMDDMSSASTDDMPDMNPTPHFSNTQPCGFRDGLQWSLNGAAHPVITIAPGERQFFRVINASGHRTLRLNIQGEKVQVVAIDGYALDTYPGTPFITESDVIIPPAARAEFVVTGPKSGRARLRTLCYFTGPDGDADPYIWLGDLVAPKHSAGGDFSTKPLTVGAPLPANYYNTKLPPPSVKRLVVFSENAKPHFFINGKSFKMSDPPMFVVKTGTVEAWHVENVTYEIHDFHIHQIHFLVESINGKKLAHPYWADSVVIPHRIGIGKQSVPGSLDLLMDFRDPIIKGEFLFHCHILDHEDQGMMAKIEAI